MSYLYICTGGSDIVLINNVPFYRSWKVYNYFVEGITILPREITPRKKLLAPIPPPPKKNLLSKLKLKMVTVDSPTSSAPRDILTLISRKLNQYHSVEKTKEYFD